MYAASKVHNTKKSQKDYHEVKPDGLFSSASIKYVCVLFLLLSSCGLNSIAFVYQVWSLEDNIYRVKSHRENKVKLNEEIEMRE